MRVEWGEPRGILLALGGVSAAAGGHGSADAIQQVMVGRRFYGYRRVQQELRQRGHCVNAKRVLRLMRDDHLLSLQTRRFVPATTDSQHGWRVWPNLARGLVTRNINELWVADITYVHLQEEFVYVAVVLDAHSRRVIGWALAQHLGASLALAGLAHGAARTQTRAGLDSSFRTFNMLAPTILRCWPSMACNRV